MKSSPIDPWPVVLFRKSVLKQNKFREITRLLGSTEGLHCLDIGADNGVVSYLLRRQGGTWKSADLGERSVAAIRDFVGDGVFQIDGQMTPFEDDEFDRVIIVDFLEHIQTDSEFAHELFRILKPGGELIINVPHDKNSFLRVIRHLIGETDEKHGHVRAGYTLDSLTRLLRGRFTIAFSNTYSKFFSEVIDTILNFAFGRLSGGQAVSVKGCIITSKEFVRYPWAFFLYSCSYPLLWSVAKLDMLLFWTSGYMLIAKAQVSKQPTSTIP